MRLEQRIIKEIMIMIGETMSPTNMNRFINIAYFDRYLCQHIRT